MKFIVEENLSPQVEVITEEKTKGMIIQGVFAEADVRNRNRRIYPKKIMDKAVDIYNEEFVSKKRAFGEAEHPSGPQVSIDRVTHLITELSMQGKQAIGKAKLLETPLGKIVREMLNAGGTVGVSTRGVGSVDLKESTEFVREDYKIYAIDIVHTPSAHNAFVNGIMEGVEWFINPDGTLSAQEIEKFQNRLDRTFKPMIPLEEAKKVREKILNEFFDRLVKRAIL